MIKDLANKFRSHCGSVQSVSGQSADGIKQSFKVYQRERAPDSTYILHAGFASARRHSSKTP